MTRSAFQGLVEQIKDESIVGKYENKISVRSSEMNLSPEEIVEMEFYSKSTEEQEQFLNTAQNQTIDVQMEEGIILISYNNNVPVTRGSELIRSSRTGVIKMQDPVMGQWGSATVTLHAVFKKSQNGNQFKLAVTSSNAEESYTSPVMIVGGTKIYDTYPVSFTGPYKGNELVCHSLTDVACAWNGSSLSIYVYPNSSFNYATIGD